MHPKSPHLIPTLFIALTSFVLLPGCGSDSDGQNTPSKPYVLTTQIEQGTFLQWHLSGQVEAQKSVQLGFQVNGQIEKRLVNPGDAVKAGDPLLELDRTDLSLKLRAAQANLAATQAELNLSKTEAKRSQDLLDRKLVSQQEYDRAQNQVTTLQQREIALQRELELAQRQLNYARLSAPAPGLVQSVLVNKGQVVSAGQALIEFLYQDGRDAVVQLPESRIHDVPKQAKATLLHQPNQTFNVTLRELKPSAHSGSRTWQAHYALPTNAQVQLGQTLRLSFGDNLNLAKVPLSALYEQANGTFIWVYNDQQVSLASVEVVHLASDFALIKTDLPSKARIVKAEVHLLKDGQAALERAL
ncbi:efflux RND transporter periplasmic adaptor subunit [Thiomicrospira pelophila]|uniref:efflux RND transporter periplasmic adaptor subunit n=1 Tax=Thiomicrospira pelophila TaxID=934 RepID=UPI0004A7735D|nr:efflux RND transporter periplasmic adaptor subunit [Thiomicrospira pelophila]